MELRVRVKSEARQALEEMSVSPKKQGALLTELLLAARDEYERLRRDPAAPPGMGMSHVLMKAIEAKNEDAAG